ncbi:MAG TPA: PilZ domain-containing protein [Burkholderiales bacterium]
MEHRWSVRKPCQRPVLLRSPQHGVFATRTRDLSLSGTCVESVGLAIPVNTLVTLELSLSAVETLTLPALVVRSMPDAVGMMFCNVSEATTERLRPYLYGEEHQASAAPAGASTASNRAAAGARRRVFP